MDFVATFYGASYHANHPSLPGLDCVGLSITTASIILRVSDRVSGQGKHAHMILSFLILLNGRSCPLIIWKTLGKDRLTSVTSIAVMSGHSSTSGLDTYTSVLLARRSRRGRMMWIMAICNHFAIFPEIEGMGRCIAEGQWPRRLQQYSIVKLR